MKSMSLFDLIGVDRHSTDIAIVKGKHEVTYGELCKLVDMFAAKIQQMSKSDSKVVPVIGKRGIAVVIAALAVSKCDRVYVPVDEGYPVSRVEEILRELNPEIIIDFRGYEWDEIILSKNISVGNCTFINYYYAYSVNEKCKKLRDISYIMYTSGSTGKPKGVMVSNLAIRNTLLWMKSEFGVTYGKRIAHRTSISFTDSVWEIFLPLISGATLVIVPAGEEKDPSKLLEIIVQQHITHIQFVPSALRIFLAYKDSAPTDVEYIFNAGEYLDVKLAEKAMHFFSKAKLVNLYGMTESAIFVTEYAVSIEEIMDWERVPLGKAIPGMKVFVVNDDGEYCSANEAGQICLAGVGLASGYWRDDKLSKEKFICIDHQIIYQTGDRGYFDADGCLWFLGREDGQVKIRGCRVEIIEVEEKISSIEYVQKAVICVHKNKYEENELICFVDAARECVEKIRVRLKEVLPVYMIPQRIIAVDEFPLTSNQKVDRKKLLDEYVQRGIAKNGKGTKKSIGENVLEEEWFDTFGEKPCETDDFWEKGGSSLDMARIYIRLENAGVYCDFQELEQCITYMEMLAVIARGKQNGKS